MKETIKETKRQPMDWEKISTNDVTDKGFISKIYKEFLQLSIKKNKHPSQKMGRRPKQTFLRRIHTGGQQTHEKMFNITNC